MLHDVLIHSLNTSNLLVSALIVFVIWKVKISFILPLLSGTKEVLAFGDVVICETKYIFHLFFRVLLTTTTAKVTEVERCSRCFLRKTGWI